jgi:hypothetical protein
MIRADGTATTCRPGRSTAIGGHDGVPADAGRRRGTMVSVRDWHAVVALGTDGGQPLVDGDRLAAGVHLLWSVRPELSFPAGGYHVWRRDHRRPEFSCLDAANGLFPAGGALSWEWSGYRLEASPGPVLLAPDACGEEDGLPERHQFHLVNERGTPSTSSYEQPAGSRLTRSRMLSSRWFTARTVVHEYGHGMVRWLSETLADPNRFSQYEDGIGAFVQRYLDERRQRASWHSELVVTNGGYALSEGLTLLIEQVLGVGASLPSGRRRTAPAGEAGWERHLYDVWVPLAGQPASSTYANPFYLSNRSGRNVEGVFAGALWEYLSGPTGLSPLYASADDTDAGCKQPREHLDDWLDHRANPTEALAQLRRMANWLLIDPLLTRVGGGAGWTGRWPDDPSGTPYPTVYDFLKRIEDQDPGGVHDPQERFSWFHDEYLIPWNLEQDPAPGLGPDWKP